MRRFLRFLDQQVVPRVHGWVFLLSGLSLVAMGMLVPAWIEVRDLAWQRDVMRAQAGSLIKQEEGYSQFHAALATDDPILLERLAFHNLRLKPIGSIALPTDYRDPTAGDMPESINTHDPVTKPGMSLVDTMLHRPVPMPGVGDVKPKPLNSRLVRIATNPTLRLGLVAAGMLCVAGGLLSTGIQPRREDHHPTVILSPRRNNTPATRIRSAA